jgi:hypothetical protein
MADEGVVAGLAQAHLEDAASPDRDVYRLHTAQGTDPRAILQDALEDPAYHVNDEMRLGPAFTT